MVKKTVSILMAVMLIFSLTACGQTDTNRSDEANSTSNETVQKNTEADAETQAVPSETQSTEESTETVEMPHENGKTLIAYFSVMEMDGVDTVAGASRVAVNGLERVC